MSNEQVLNAFSGGEKSTGMNIPVFSEQESRVLKIPAGEYPATFLGMVYEKVPGSTSPVVMRFVLSFEIDGGEHGVLKLKHFCKCVPSIMWKFGLACRALGIPSGDDVDVSPYEGNRCMVRVVDGFSNPDYSDIDRCLTPLPKSNTAGLSTDPDDDIAF